MASYIEGVLRSILVNTAAVGDLVGNRVYWQKTPQEPTVPCVVYFAVADPHLPLYMSPDESKAKSGQRLFQFTCMSDKSIEGLNLQQKVMNTLRWAQGTTYGFTIEVITIENMRQRIDPVTDLYLNDVDAIVEYFEA